MCIDAPYLKGAGPDMPDKFGKKSVTTTNPICDDSGNVKEENAAPTEIGQKASVPIQIKLEPAISKDFIDDRQSSSNKKEQPTPLKISPSQELYQYFTKLLNPNQISQVKNYFVIWEHRFTKIIRYTCNFTSPISLETFACGHIPEESEGAILHDSCYWYRESSVTFYLSISIPVVFLTVFCVTFTESKQLAKDAAAAKALGKTKILTISLGDKFFEAYE